MFRGAAQSLFLSGAGGGGVPAETLRAISNRGQFATATRTVSGGRTRMDFRMRYVVRQASPTISFGWCNRALLTNLNGSVNGGDTTIRSLAIEKGGIASTVTFSGGSASRTVLAGELKALTDKMPIAVLPGDVIMLRGSVDLPTTYVTNKLYSGLTTLGDTPAEQCWVYDPANAGNTILATGAMTAPTGAATSVPFGPVLMLGEPADLTAMTVVGIGTSIEDYADEFDASSGSDGGGHYRRASALLNAPYTSFAQSSGTAAGAVAAIDMLTAFAPYHNRGWLGHGTNDVALGRTFIQVTSDLSTIISTLKSFGHKVFESMILPRVTTANYCVTLAGQTPVFRFGAGELVDDVNAWILAGAGGLPDGIINNLAIAGDPSDLHKWKPRPFTANLTSASGAGAATFFMNAKPPETLEYLAIEAGTANQSVGQFMVIQSIGGTVSPFTVVMYGADTSGIAHANGSPVVASPSRDGIHPPTPTHRAMATLIQSTVN